MAVKEDEILELRGRAGGCVLNSSIGWFWQNLPVLSHK